MMMRTAPLLLAAVAAFAAEPAAPATAGASASAASKGEAAPVLRPSFGWTVPDGPVDPKDPGLAVIEVRPGSTASALGIEAGDRILSLNGTPLKASDDVRTFLAGSTIGAPVTVEFKRGGQVRTASGVMLERPKPVNLAQELANARAELAQLKALAADKAKEPSLAEVLQALQDLDKRLPKAVASFKKQYPNGEFDVRISITICSDKNAKDPIEITNVGAGPATPAATASGSAAKDEKRK